MTQYCQRNPEDKEQIPPQTSGNTIEQQSSKQHGTGTGGTMEQKRQPSNKTIVNWA